MGVNVVQEDWDNRKLSEYDCSKIGNRISGNTFASLTFGQVVQHLSVRCKDASDVCPVQNILALKCQNI